ncbi:glycosyltransferase family 4 protein [Desulfoluna spongiiphila]|uniref:glycosyltransferase family 4 protein n=1 Tax=Desulfoluna spongiiphila TaxID=419481 RepID=UPI00125AEB06|nr:glycosyltransferase family 4 protein [Desulfoluna spongiiphila]VVS95026.1 glycosyl transferase family 1 [Desulfoluna spongiiphila]
MSTSQPSLRICLVSYRSNPYCGGQGVYIRHLARALADLGHRVHVLSGEPAPILDDDIGLTVLRGLDLYSPETMENGAAYSRLKDPLNFSEWWINSTLGYPEPFAFGARARRFFEAEGHRFDIIHDNQSLSWGLLSVSRKIPTVATIHHPMTRDRDIAVMSTRNLWKRARAMRWYSFIGMQKRVARKLPAVITVSNVSKHDIASDFGVSSDRLHVIPIGIDTSRFFPLPEVPKDPLRIIVTNSADSPLKGLYYLMHAVSAMKDEREVRLTVIGKPKEGGIVQRLVSSLGLSDVVEFTGRVSDRRLVHEYARASVAVVPSLYEGFGLPVGEAMACGVPVVCTDGGALPEVAGDAARIVPAGDVQALKDGLSELLDDRDVADGFARKGADRVHRRFVWKRTAEETVDVYRRVMNRH